MSYLEAQRMKRNETLIDVGEKSATIYIVEHGQVTIYTQLPNGQKRRMSTMGAGAMLGTWNIPENGSVVTEQRCQLFLLSPASLQKMEAEDPALAAAFFRFIAHHTGEYLLLANTTIDRLLS